MWHIWTCEDGIWHPLGFPIPERYSDDDADNLLSKLWSPRIALYVTDTDCAEWQGRDQMMIYNGKIQLDLYDAHKP